MPHPRTMWCKFADIGASLLHWVNLQFQPIFLIYPHLPNPASKLRGLWGNGFCFGGGDIWVIYGFSKILENFPRSQGNFHKVAVSTNIPYLPSLPPNPQASLGAFGEPGKLPLKLRKLLKCSKQPKPYFNRGGGAPPRILFEHDQKPV